MSCESVAMPIRVSARCREVSTRAAPPARDTAAVRSILVTGSHRSGTGWVGQVLAASPAAVGYVWEPFSILHRPGTCAAQPVLLVRHPAAFAASVKRLHLRHPFGDFLAQPLMLRDWLGPFRAELEAFARAEQEIVDQAILLWNVIHHALAAYRARHPD